MTKPRWAVGALCAPMAAGAAALLLSGGASGSEGDARQPEARSAAVARASALAARSNRVISVRSPALTTAAARHFARRRQRAIPLPAGGNFNGIRWARAPRPLSPGAAEQTLEYNARCQWLRAAAESREAAAAVVLRSAARWPALRALPPLSATPSLLADCYASHRREVAYARRGGLIPSA